MIAIHNSGQWSFRPEWVAYCEQKSISYKLVDAYDSDIISQIKDCEAFLFHHHHTSAVDYNFAKQLLFSLEQSGMKVFPDFNTGWYFDDKLGQKYLLESIDAPMVNTHTYYDRPTAYNFIDQATFPLVFKLRGGAGSNNVKLLRNKDEAIKKVNQCFGQGFENYDRIGDLKENIRRYKLKKASIQDVLKSLRRVFKSTEFGKTAGRERGYFLVQDFIPNNTSDTRVITIGDKAFAIKRPVRKGDFRASGSGEILYDRREIDERCVSIAFETTQKLKAQCVAYDFVFDQENQPLIVEINYGFAHRAYDLCPGYWTKDMDFVEGKVNPCGWMIENLVK